MKTQQTMYWSGARRFVAGTGAVLASMVWIQAGAALLRGFGPDSVPLAAVELTVAAALVAAVGAALLPRRGAEWMAAAAGAVAAVVIAAVVPGSWAAALALPLLGGLVTLGARWLAARLPERVDFLLTARRGRVLLWAVLALLSVVQVGRLSAYMTDQDLNFFVATSHPFWYGHQCLPAYLHGAELALRGEPNVYDAAHWPALDPQAAPVTELAIGVDDPYQYTPQFLLLPTLALSLTHDVTVLRAVWFALNLSLFAAAFAALALWIGGRAGRLALWCLPLALSAFPLLFNFQFGQFHLAAISLAVLGMLAFARGRSALGGGLLAVAILGKLFPAVLLIPLLVRRRFREVAWTGAWVAVATALAFALLGAAPFTAFLDYHLPRLADGSAFAFDEAWPELASLVVADNQGVFGLARKLGVGKPVASWISRLFGLSLLAAAALAGLRLRPGVSRWARGVMWLALLGLGSLASPGAWGDYVPGTAIWLLALLAAKAAESRGVAVALGIAAALQYTLLGTYPIAGWEPAALMAGVSALGSIAMLALFGGALALPSRFFPAAAAWAAPPAAEPLRRAA